MGKKRARKKICQMKKGANWIEINQKTFKKLKKDKKKLTILNELKSDNSKYGEKVPVQCGNDTFRYVLDAGVADLLKSAYHPWVNLSTTERILDMQKELEKVRAHEQTYEWDIFDKYYTTTRNDEQIEDVPEAVQKAFYEIARPSMFDGNKGEDESN